MIGHPVGTVPKRGNKLKEIPVDLGGIAVVDIAAVCDSMPEDEVRYEKWLEALVYEPEDESMSAIARWKPTKTEEPLCKPDAVNPVMASRFQVVTHWCGATDPERWPETIVCGVPEPQ